MPISFNFGARVLTMNKYLLILCLFMASCAKPFAQAGHPPQAVDKKASNFLNEARISLNQGDSRTCMEFLQKAIAIQPDYLDANNTLGYLYMTFSIDYDKAIGCFKKVIETDPEYDVNAYLMLGESYFMKDDFTEATTLLNKLKKDHARLLTDRVTHKVNIMIANCDFSVEAKAHPVPFEPINAGPEVNSPMNEYFPALTADNKFIYFTRSQKNANGQEDLWYSVNMGKGWNPAASVGDPINTPDGNEGAHTVSPDGKYLIYTSCDKEGGFGSCDLYISKRVGDVWTAPKNLGPEINSRGWESQPSISGDGKNLYFVRKTGANGTDIFVSRLVEGKGFSTPVALGPEINTPGTEQRPFIHPDNKTLYFMSDGHPGMGGMDLFVSRKDANDKWSKAENLGYPINTKEDESGIFVSRDGQMAYFSSGRAGGLGGEDIYYFKLYDKAQPDVVTYVKGTVFDADTKAPLQANIQLFDLESGEKLATLSSDPKNGNFLLTLPAGKNYLYNVSRDGYLFYSENFSLKDHNPSEPYSLEVPLNKIQEGKSVILKNIFFETGKYDIKPESKLELNKLVDLLKMNPGMKIEIGGHTDNVGNDADNLKLSDNRARAVKDYISSQGIDAARLSSKGYGKTKPIADNGSDAGRAQNRRTEFTVVGK